MRYGVFPKVLLGGSMRGPRGRVLIFSIIPWAYFYGLGPFEGPPRGSRGSVEGITVHFLGGPLKICVNSPLFGGGHSRVFGLFGGAFRKCPFEKI